MLASLRLVLAATLGAAALSTGDELKVLRVSPEERRRGDRRRHRHLRPPGGGRARLYRRSRAPFSVSPRASWARLEWRDPVTIRFHPSAPLPAGVTFTVTHRQHLPRHGRQPSRGAVHLLVPRQGPRVLDALPGDQWSQSEVPDARRALSRPALRRPVDLGPPGARSRQVDAGTASRASGPRCAPCGSAASRARMSAGATTATDLPDSSRDPAPRGGARPRRARCPWIAQATLGVPERVDSVTSLPLLGLPHLRPAHRRRRRLRLRHRPLPHRARARSTSARRCAAPRSCVACTWPRPSPSTSTDTAAEYVDWSLDAAAQAAHPLPRHGGQRADRRLRPAAHRALHQERRHHLLHAAVSYTYGRMVVERTGPAHARRAARERRFARRHDRRACPIRSSRASSATRAAGATCGRS